MTDKSKFNLPKGSLKRGLLKAILLSIILAVIVYILASATSEYIRTAFYATDEGREGRERVLLSEFQEYVVSNEISAQDTARIEKWVEKKTYIYLLLYKGDDLYFSSGMYDNASIIPLFSNLVLGGSVDYPTEEEMLEYAKENDLVRVEMSDGAVYASVTEFSEYFFRDVARIISLSLAMLAIAVTITVYFFKIVNRITKLAGEVTIVAEGNLNHKLVCDGDDEISKLSNNVENMRSAILEILESERTARQSNTELITSMSHDIRTPLTVLIGYLDIMKMRSKDEVMNEYIVSSEKTAMRLKKLSDDMFKYLLVFGNSDSQVELEEYDGKTLIDQLLYEHILLLREQGYNVEFNFSDGEECTVVLTNAPYLMRIVDNMFSNISKYADKERSVKILVSAEKENVTISFQNYIAHNNTMAESTGIGLKTSAKIAELISCEFSYTKSEDVFSAKISLTSHR